MLKFFATYAHLILTILSTIVLTLGALHLINMNNPVEKFAQEVLEAETGIKIEEDAHD